MNSFELASSTPITVDDLRQADSRGFRGRLFNRYVQRDRLAAPAAIVGSLVDVATLEEQVQQMGNHPARLFTLAHLFRATLERPELTSVPGHGTVMGVGIADGDLGVQQNLLVEGTLLVAGDLTVGGQLVVGDAGIVIVTGSLHASAVAASGQISVARDLRVMFAEVSGEDVSLDVSDELDAFLLIQNDQRVRAGALSVGVHAVYPQRDDVEAVFQLAMIGRDGRPDWTAIARAAQAGEDILADEYATPEPATESLVELLA